MKNVLAACYKYKQWTSMDCAIQTCLKVGDLPRRSFINWTIQRISFESWTIQPLRRLWGGKLAMKT